jgi:hypothetical protein
MFRNLLKLFLLNKLVGGGSKGTRRGGMGCFGLILILALIYFIYRYFFSV